MSWVYIVFKDEDGDCPYISAVFSAKDKAERWIMRRMEEHEDGMPLYDYDSFYIETALLDDEDVPY